MNSANPQTLKDVMDSLNSIHQLLSNQDPYLPVWSALGGALIGSVATVIPNSIGKWQETRSLRRSTALQIYAEIKATLEVVEHRQYVQHIENIILHLKANPTATFTFQVLVTDDRHLIYKSNLQNIGLLPPSIQTKIVEFYMLAEAVTQDMMPGGILNATTPGLREFEEVLSIGNKAIAVGKNIMAMVEKKYGL